MSVAGLIQLYGYPALALGTFLEGETVLFIAGVAASHGQLALSDVIAVATLASLAGDQLYFYLGRWYGDRLLCRFPSLRPRTERVLAYLEHHHVSLILSVRFLYGLRIAGPLALGMSSVPGVRYLCLNALGALVWASLVASLGYGLGHTLGHLFGLLRHDERLLLAMLLIAALLWGWLRRGLRRIGEGGAD
ncbi:MAG: DedA family protein [Sterolibacterium sp.]|nr:DedA family protein [Sterolibacterium sp.]MBP9799914.1 DedA family protein [Sterolibacterium sp.]